MTDLPKPLTRRAQAAVACLVLTILGAVVSLVADHGQLDLINRAAAGGQVTLAEALDADRQIRTAVKVELGAYGLSVITFLMWVHAAFRNTRALGGRPRFGSTWAVLSWFVPILCLVRPKQVMNDLWRGGTAAGNEAEFAALPVNPLLHWWWATLLLAGVSLRVAVSGGVSGDRTAALENLHNRFSGAMFAHAVQIVAAVLAILVVSQITERLEARRQAPPRATVPPSPAASVDPRLASSQPPPFV